LPKDEPPLAKMVWRTLLAAVLIFVVGAAIAVSFGNDILSVVLFAVACTVIYALVAV